MYKKKQRKIESFRITGDEKIFKEKMLNWCNRFSIFSFLDSCGYADKYGRYNCLAAAGTEKKFAGNISAFHHFYEKNNDWLFGHISYDSGAKKGGEETHDGFGDLLFFQPRVVLILKKSILIIESVSRPPGDVFQAILQQEIIPAKTGNNQKINIRTDIEKEEYIFIIQQLKKHIQRGDCYEINFCIQFFAENYSINPLELFNKLIAVSPNPFSCLYKNEHNFLICASPERFLQKAGRQIISQPIKGTAGRDLQHEANDNLQKKLLRESRKEQSENVMAVDLVRNDLSRFCEEGSVHVSELFGIYTFPQVYQMISTVEGIVPININLSDIIDAAFPMASMTGAPKKKVMELISQYEKTKRGIFSGTVGYVSPDKDFDFNVVIRSIVYNNTTKRLSFPVGGGITWLCEPEKEYEECLLKASAIRKILE
ncbi:MAG: anthranilate synthase component I family protein [Bacteroidota bacterium]